MAVRLWDIANRGRGRRGGGEAETTPPPMSPASLDEHLFARPPPPPGRCRGLLPPPSEGAGKCLAIVRIQCPGGREGIPVRVFTLATERGSLSWQCIDGISPRGGGADGEGAERPFPCRCVPLVHPHHPAAPRPPPAPSRGGGQSVAIAPDTVHGEQEQDFSQGCSHRAADLLILAGTLYRWDIAPRGRG